MADDDVPTDRQGRPLPPPETPDESMNSRRERLSKSLKKAHRTRYENAKAKREKLLELVQGGTPLAEAKELVGFSSSTTMQYHRRNYPLWAQQLDLAKDQGRQIRSAAKAPGARPEKVVNAGDAFQAFVTRYFPDRRPHQPQQIAIVNELNNLGPREICMFLIHPEAGKTSTFEDYICKTLAADKPNHRFRIVSEGQDLAKRIVGTCARRFTDESMYPKFITRYGPFYEKGQERTGRPWAADQFTTMKNTGGERDRSLVASGWTSQVYGSRIDTLILDDIQSQKNYNQSEEIFRRIRGTFLNRGLELRTLIVGTRIGPGDFYERMLDAGLVTRLVKLPAANADGNPTVPEFWDRPIFHGVQGEPTGPCCTGFRECPRNGERLTPREFMDLMRHQSGEETWWSAYQQQPSADERSSFGELLERCYDRHRTYGHLENNLVDA